MAAVTICSDFGAQKIKSDTVSTVSPSISYEVMGPDAMIFVFWMLSFKPTFPLSSFTFIKRLFSSSSLSAIKVVLSAYLRLLIFLLAILIPFTLGFYYIRLLLIFLLSTFPSFMPQKIDILRIVLLNCGVWQDSWESLGLQGDPTSLS